jgi:hypothetical protein
VPAIPYEIARPPNSEQALGGEGERAAREAGHRASAGLRGSIPPIHLILEAKLEEGADHEENISAESHEATQEARFQRADEDARRSRDHQAAAGQGA